MTKKQKKIFDDESMEGQISNLLSEYMKDIFAYINGEKKITPLDFPVFDCFAVTEKIMAIVRRNEQKKMENKIDYFSPYQQWTRWEQQLKGIDNYGETSYSNG